MDMSSLSSIPSITIFYGTNTICRKLIHGVDFQKGL